MPLDSIELLEEAEPLLPLEASEVASPPPPLKGSNSWATCLADAVGAELAAELVSRFRLCEADLEARVAASLVAALALVAGAATGALAGSVGAGAGA